MNPDNRSRWLRAFRFNRRDIVAEVDDELEFHIAMRIKRNIELGMSADEARRDALARFGDASRWRDSLVDHDTRKQKTEVRKEYLSDLWHDVRFGLRSLRRAPGFAVAAILTLGLGIGANAAIFSVLNAVVLRPLPFTRPAELVTIGQGSAGEFVALRERLRSFSNLALYVEQTHPVDDGEEAHRLLGAAISPNLLATLGVSPMLGRGFTEREGTLAEGRVLLLSHGLWERRFGAAAGGLGRRLLVEGVPFTIVGVMPPAFRFPRKEVEYWLPYAFNPANAGLTWAVGGKRFIGRLAPGVTLAQARGEVREVWPGLRTENPLWDAGPDYRRDADAVPLRDSVVGSTNTLIWILFGSVLLVLLIGCVNVANLLLARATARERELAVRAALGGGRERLIRQLVTESLLLSALGSLVGILLALAAVTWLGAAVPADLPRAEGIGVSGAVLAFTAGIALVTGAVFGIVPAIRATDVALAAAGGRRTTAGRGHSRVAAALVAAEVALAVVLVIGSTLLVRSFQELRRVEPGFRPERVLAARLTPPEAIYRDPARAAALYDRVLERVAAVPGVERVAAVDRLPIAQPVWGMAVRVEGQFEDASRVLPEVDHTQVVTPAYFETMGIPILQGRAFTDADRAGQAPVAIVSAAVAREFWPGQDPLGRRIGYPWESPWLTIVGVVPDTKQDSLREAPGTSVYVPWGQRGRATGAEMWVVVRAAGDPAALAGTIRSVVADVDRAVPVSDVRTMDGVLSESVAKARFTTRLIGAFALSALLLGAIGIYGVMSYLVGQRTQEMGVRLALGASPAGVIGLVVGRAALLAAIGAGAGVVIAFAASRSLASMLYGVSPTDPLTFVLVPLLFLLVAMLASYAPARRATRVDPVRALRSD